MPDDRLEFSPGERVRYARHFALPEVGIEGQTKLSAAKVALVGAGGLGCPAAVYLAAAGVGTLGLIDFDEVDATNLQRQILHGTADIGRLKIDSAAEALGDVNPHVRVVRHPVRLSSENALEILCEYDVIVDGSDNFPTRYLVNDACVLLGKPSVYGSILRWDGQVSVFGAPGGPCYRCLFREPPPPGLVPNCAEGGVLGVLPGVVGSLQALEAIKLILGVGRGLAGRLLIFDALELSWREVALRRNSECPVCGDEPTITELIDYEDFCGLREQEQVECEARRGIPGISVLELKALLEGGTKPLLLDVREPFEWEICNLEEFGAVLMPLSELAASTDTLPADRSIAVYCRSGWRSALAVRALLEGGFKEVVNVEGGVLAWATEVDLDFPKY
jgi:sulfur-carrier protein adenylyltransferase/sulfurtransferase